MIWLYICIFIDWLLFDKHCVRGLLLYCILRSMTDIHNHNFGLKNVISSTHRLFINIVVTRETLFIQYSRKVWWGGEKLGELGIWKVLSRKSLENISHLTAHATWQVWRTWWALCFFMLVSRFAICQLQQVLPLIHWFMDMYTKKFGLTQWTRGN